MSVCVCHRTGASSEPCVSFSTRSSGRLRLKPDKFLEAERIKAQRALLRSMCLQCIQLCVDSVSCLACVCVLIHRHEDTQSLFAAKSQSFLLESYKVLCLRAFMSHWSCGANASPNGAAQGYLSQHHTGFVHCYMYLLYSVPGYFGKSVHDVRMKSYKPTR